MNSSLARCCAAFALVASMAGAQAANVTLSGWTQGSANVVSTTLYSGAVGAVGGALQGSGWLDSAAFTAYRVEADGPFAIGNGTVSDYALVEGSDYFAQRRGGADVADKLGRLFTFAAAHPELVDTALKTGAMQVAVWELIYDDDWTVTRRRAGFRDNNPGSRSGNWTDLLLDGALHTPTSSFDVFVLAKAGAPNLLVVAPKGLRDATVPEPGTLLLGSAALAALALTRRRRD